jgi:DNA-binding response OmpR family regulator
LFIHQNIILYNILHELEETTKYKICYVDDKHLKSDFQDVNNNLLITSKKVDKISNQFQLNHLPIRFIKLLENINIYFLKQNFKNQSKINIGKFIIDINSRRLILNNDHINLTEKEINLILFLFNKKLPCNIENLQKNVWGFKRDLETHTVETHVHRLRKKILKKFDEDEFIISGNNGYFIKT